MQQETYRHIRNALLLLIGVLFFGVVGYMLLEGWSFLDALYMTVISITTTGFREVHPLSPHGQVLTLIILILGVVTIAYLGGRLAQLLLESYLFRRRKMEKNVRKMEKHYIVCGYGRMGKKICQELENQKAPFVIVENNPAEIELLHNTSYLFVEGDATDDEVLLKAGIQRAKGLVAVLPTEAENVFTTLSAKVLNPNIFVVSRAVEEKTESKLIKAGADRVVKPYEIGGFRMAQVLLRPGVVDFIDVIARDRQIDLKIEEMEVHSSSPLVGKTLAESPIRNTYNCIIVAIMSANQQFHYNPQSNAKIRAGDKLIVLGEEKNIQALASIAAGEKKG